MRASIRRGEGRIGGVVTGYPLERLQEEVAFLAYYFHWPYAEVMNLEHRERRQWCEEISRINRKINEQAQSNR